MADQDPVAQAPAAPPGEAGRAELEATFAAAFEEHDPGQAGDDEGDPQPVEAVAGSDALPGPARGEDGKFVAREAQADDDAPPPAEGKAAAEAAPKDDETYEKALLALRYSGVPSAIIKNASRDELIAWGTEAADRRAKQEAALEERATRIRELEEGAAKVPASDPAKPAAADWSPHLKVLAEKLGLDPEDAKEAFGPMLDAVASQVRSEFEGRLSPIEKTTKDAMAAEGRRQISEQVRRLSETHPKLKTDEDLVNKLNAKALTLWKSGGYSDAESVYEDASRLVLGAAPTPGLAAKRRNGSAAPPEGRVEDRTENSDDAFMKALDRVEAGDMRGAKRVGSQVVWGHNDGRR